MDFGYDEKGNRISSTAEDSSGRSSPVSSDDGNDGVRPSSLSAPREGQGERFEEEYSSSNEEEVLSDSSSVSHTRHTKKNDKKKNRVHFDAEEGDDSSSSPSEASTSSSSSSEDYSSSSDSEAEIIVGEEPTQQISEPLVPPAEVLHSLPGSREGERGRNTFFLTSGPQDEDDTSGQEGGGRRGRDASGRPLLLTGRPSSGDSLASFIDTLASIGGRGGVSSFSSSSTISTSELAPTVRSRVRSAVLIGSLHHGKSSFLRLLLSSSKTSSDGVSNSTGESSSRSQNIASYSSPLSSHMNIVGYQQSVDEMERQVTIKSHMITTIARGSRMSQSSHLLTLLDTPGHADLFCEAAAAMRVSDAAVLCVDVVESLLSSGEALLEQAVRIEKIPILLVLTKLDRLIVELKLPPVDAYRKLRHVVDTVNNAIYRFTREVEKEECHRSFPHTSRTTSPAHPAASPSFLVSPENGTVCFSSAVLGVCFSLETFAHKYAEVYRSVVSPALLSQQLWGQHTFKEKRFQRITSVQQKPSFVQFILEPLYKIVSHAVCGSGSAMEQLGMEEANGARPLLPRAPLLAVQQSMQYFCGAPGEEGLDILLAALPDPHDRSRWLLNYYQPIRKQENLFSSFFTEEEEDRTKMQDDHEAQKEDAETTWGGGEKIRSSSSSSSVFAIAPLVRLYKENSVAAVVRVLRGTLQCRDSLVVVDDSCGEDAPYYTIKVKQLFLLSPDADAVGKNGSDDLHESNRRRGKDGFLPITQARENQVVFMTGLGQRSGSHLVFIGGAAVSSVLTPNHEMEEEEEEELMQWFNLIRPPRHFTPLFPPLIHVDLELKDPQKADFFKDCLQLLQRTTPGMDVHRQEAGEFTLQGYGEFHLDVVLRELRQVLAPDVRLGISPPYVSFSETVQEDEGILAVAGARRAAVGCVSGVMSSPELEDVVVRGKLPIELLSSVSSSALNSTTKDVALEWRSLLREKYGLDALDAQHIMAVGPDSLTGPNIFFDDTLEEERHISIDGLSTAHREAIIAGFRAAVAAGPLIGEVVRGVRLQLIFADIDSETKPSVVLANARSAARQSLLGARPRLLEPILSCEILCSSGEEGIKIVKGILEQRRGVVLYELPIPATTLTRYQALVPALDSFGLETQIRMATHGQCFPSFRFYHWDVVPGDPFDGTVNVGRLDVAQGHELARDFVMKTRFRKGLSSQLVGGEW